MSTFSKLLHALLRPALHGSALCAALLFAASLAQAGVLGPFSGTVDNQDAVQNGRIFRDNIPSDGVSLKPWPGTLFGGQQFHYEAFTFYNNNAQAELMTIEVLGNNNLGVHFSAFQGQAYDSGVLDRNAANFLGDLGDSRMTSFRIIAPASRAFTVIVSANASDTRTAFSFSLNGQASLTPGAVPVPAGAPLLLAGVLGWRLSRAARREGRSLQSARRNATA